MDLLQASLAEKRARHPPLEQRDSDFLSSESDVERRNKIQEREVSQLLSIQTKNRDSYSRVCSFKKSTIM